MTINEMTATKALEILKHAAVAASYLENVAQKTVNGNAVVIAEVVKSGDDVDGQTFSQSWKVKANTTKFGKACLKMITIAEAHQAWEAKQKAIPAEVIKAKKALPAPVAA
jgi:hypothetical protein